MEGQARHANSANGVTPPSSASTSTSASDSDEPAKNLVMRNGRDAEHQTANWIKESGARYLRIYWHDYTSSAKCRVVPIERVRENFEAGTKPFTLSVSKAMLGILPNDTLVPGVTGTGMYTLQPDWATLRQGPAPEHISCAAYLLDASADPPSSPGSRARLCPRAILDRAIQHAASAAGGGLTFLVGFEVEFTLLERTGDPEAKYRRLSRDDDGHAYAAARALAGWGTPGSAGTAAGEILAALARAGLRVEQFHAEAGAGQFEVVLAPLAPLAACDALLHARQVVESGAARHGLRATLHPRPFPGGIGNGAHVHLSLASAGGGCSGDDRRVYERFYGGVLAHFRALFAFTNAHPASYERVADGIWAGGRWATWGVHNKEAPLRKCEGSHWEVKVMDGMANPYLALAAIISAGTAGADEFTWRDCPVDPATLSGEERAALGIVEQFPASLEEALEALERDDVMVDLLGKDVVDRYVAVKKAEIKLLHSIPEQSRRMWVMERY